MGFHRSGPADNIHELVNPNFLPSQLQEAVEAMSPRASMRRYSSMGFMRASVLTGGGSSDNLAALGASMGMGRKNSWEPSRARASSMPVGPAAGGLVCLSRLGSSTDQSEEDGGGGQNGVPGLSARDGDHAQPGLGHGHGQQAQRSPGERDALIQELARDRVLLGEGSGMPPSRYGSALKLQFTDAKPLGSGALGLDDPAHRRQAEVEDSGGGAQEPMQVQEGVERGRESEAGRSTPPESTDTPSQTAGGSEAEGSGGSRVSQGGLRTGLGFRFGWKLRPPATSEKTPVPDAPLGATDSDTQPTEDGILDVDQQSSQETDESGELGLPLGSNRAEHLSQKRLLGKDSKEQS